MKTKQNIRSVAYGASGSTDICTLWIQGRIREWAKESGRQEEKNREHAEGWNFPTLLNQEHHQDFDYWLRKKFLIDEFTRQYIITALWSTTDDNETPLDENYTIDDLAPETLEQIVDDCRSFQDENQKYITDDLGMAGHDFWLTRNGHGVGFWDGDWEEPAATALDKSSKAFGEINLYVGDTGRVHL